MGKHLRRLKAPSSALSRQQSEIGSSLFSDLNFKFGPSVLFQAGYFKDIDF